MIDGYSELFDVTEPVLPFRLADASVQVAANLLEFGSGGGFDGKEVAADAGMFVHTLGGVGADALSELDAALLEVFS